MSENTKAGTNFQSDIEEDIFHVFTCLEDSNTRDETEETENSIIETVDSNERKDTDCSSKGNANYSCVMNVKGESEDKLCVKNRSSEEREQIKITLRKESQSISNKKVDCEKKCYTQSKDKIKRKLESESRSKYCKGEGETQKPRTSTKITDTNKKFKSNDNQSNYSCVMNVKGESEDKLCVRNRSSKEREQIKVIFHKESKNISNKGVDYEKKCYTQFKDTIECKLATESRFQFCKGEGEAEKPTRSTKITDTNNKFKPSDNQSNACKTEKGIESPSRKTKNNTSRDGQTRSVKMCDQIAAALSPQVLIKKDVAISNTINTTNKTNKTPKNVEGGPNYSTVPGQSSSCATTNVTNNCLNEDSNFTNQLNVSSDITQNTRVLKEVCDSNPKLGFGYYVERKEKDPEDEKDSSTFEDFSLKIDSESKNVNNVSIKYDTEDGENDLKIDKDNLTEEETKKNKDGASENTNELKSCKKSCKAKGSQKCNNKVSKKKYLKTLKSKICKEVKHVLLKSNKSTARNSNKKSPTCNPLKHSKKIKSTDTTRTRDIPRRNLNNSRISILGDIVSLINENYIRSGKSLFSGNLAEREKALTARELQEVRSKFLRDGHFRLDPKALPFINDSHIANRNYKITEKLHKDHLPKSEPYDPNIEIKKQVQLTGDASCAGSSNQASYLQRRSNNLDKMTCVSNEVHRSSATIIPVVDLTVDDSMGAPKSALRTNRNLHGTEVGGCPNINDKSSFGTFLNHKELNPSNIQSSAVTNDFYPIPNTPSNYGSFYSNNNTPTGNTQTCRNSISNFNFLNDSSLIPNAINQMKNNRGSFNNLNFANDPSALMPTINQINSNAKPNFQNTGLKGQTDRNETQEAFSTTHTNENTLLTSAINAVLLSNLSPSKPLNLGASMPNQMPNMGNAAGFNSMNNTYSMTNNQNPLMSRNSNFNNNHTTGCTTQNSWNGVQPFYYPYESNVNSHYNNVNNYRYNSFNGFDVTMLNGQAYFGNDMNARAQNVFPGGKNEHTDIHTSISNNSLDTSNVNSIPTQGISSLSDSSLMSQANSILSNNNTCSDFSASNSESNGMSRMPAQSQTFLQDNSYANKNYTHTNTSTRDGSGKRIEQTYVPYMQQQYGYNVSSDKVPTAVGLIKHNTNGDQRQRSPSEYYTLHPLQFQNNSSYHMATQQSSVSDCVSIESSPNDRVPEMYQIRQQFPNYTKRITENRSSMINHTELPVKREKGIYEESSSASGTTTLI